jgi:hypothetical protein
MQSILTQQEQRILNRGLCYDLGVGYPRFTIPDELFEQWAILDPLNDPDFHRDNSTLEKRFAQTALNFLGISQENIGVFPVLSGSHALERAISACLDCVI